MLEIAMSATGRCDEPEQACVVSTLIFFAVFAISLLRWVVQSTIKVNKK